MTNIQTREDYMTLLRDNICVVTFTKRDGTERVMRCTLREEHLPKVSAEPVSESKPVRKTNLNTVSVWDMDKNAWRGFTVNSVKTIKQES
jgi:hypothetical protein